MKSIGFYLLKWWVDFQSIQPYWLLYLKSDVYCFLMYHVVRYRRNVVRQNLLRSFPDKDAKEIMNEFKASPRGFFNANKNNLYAVCYGMALPPEWEQNATK